MLDALLLLVQNQERALALDLRNPLTAQSRTSSPEETVGLGNRLNYRHNNVNGMTLEEPSRKEVEEAVRYLEELRKDPERYQKWLDSVVDKALRGWRTWKGRAPKTKRS